MWTQKDQIQAYQFLRRRLVSALVSADANHPVSPSKRLLLGTGIGLAVALIVSAVFGIIGLLTPSRAEEWRQGGQVIMEKETGARFILGQDGALHPVLNYASARLLAGGDGGKTVTVPAKTLRDVPRGAGAGIVGAPDSLPQNDRLRAGPWTSCTRLSADRPAGDEPISTVLLGQEFAGPPLPDGAAILARLRSGERFVITGGHRHRLADDRAVVALGYASADSVTVAPTWLNTIPAGRDLATIDVQRSGAPGPAVGRAATRIGQVLVSGAEEFYLVRGDGLAVISGTEAALVLGSPASVAAYPDARPRPIPLPAADIAAAPRSAERADGYPRRRPEPVGVQPTTTLCATGARITIGTGLPLPSGAKPHSVPQSAGAAAEVYVPGGAGAVVAEEPAPGAASGTTYLITDTGQKYPLSGDEAIKALGYGRVSRPGVPAAVLALFPTGPTLDPAQARRTVGS
ncbi:MAG TPA: type VII secretion protein EccB [Actinophytocola sp.]|uniref:type VII secretion protein EccB n=1 Tax=Actinophytocola sp. TaxID=1872138 RepID=UPI002DBAAE7B|nr:type VII secretion protein EccB [Actinophytocola sp.]HEU5475333.1 type VII secretion protein EccB [Actinophytocola sp.]